MISVLLKQELILSFEFNPASPVFYKKKVNKEMRLFIPQMMMTFTYCLEH